MQRDPLELRTLRDDLDAIRTDIEELRADTKELLDAWKAAGTMLNFVKWASGLVTAIAAAWLVLRNGFHR